MPEIRVQDEQGTIHVFPDGSTPEMIAQVMKVKPPSSGPTLTNQQPEKEGGLGALGSDLMGMVKAAPQMMGPMAFIQAGKHIAEDVRNYKATGQTTEQQSAADRRAKGYGAGYSYFNAPVGEAIGVNVPGMEHAADVGDSAGVLGHAAAVPVAMALTAGLAKGAPRVAARIGDAFPSIERARSNFQDVMGTAKGQPIPITDELSGALSRYQELVDRGGSRSMAVSKLLNRITNPEAPAMTYAEGRDFASNISRLSADEFQRLTPQMKQQVGAVRVALNNAVGQAAEGAGKGAQYQSAMQEYAKASKVKGIAKDFTDAAVKKLPYIGAGYAIKKAYDAF